MGNPTGYYRPRTIDEAVRLLAQPHIKTVLLSGGALRLAMDEDPEYEAVIDVQSIPGLSTIRGGGGGSGLQIGAAASLQAVVETPSAPRLLRDVIRRVVTINRRNAISIAEVVEYPARLSEIVVALLALDATLVFALPEERRMRLAELDRQSGEPRRLQKGLITAIEFPAVDPWQVWGEAHVARTPADAAIVSAAAVLVTDAAGMIRTARLALAGVWPQPARLAEAANASLVGRALNDDAIAKALTALDSEIAPVGDYRGSVAYRRAMAPVIARRALAACRVRLTE